MYIKLVMRCQEQTHKMTVLHNEALIYIHMALSRHNIIAD